ncbi:MAG: hypothetical protein ABGX25_04485 [Nautiliaceae bacterium]
MIFFLFFPLLLFGLEINVDYGKNQNIPYEVLTLYEKFPFTCTTDNNKIECLFDKVPKTPVFKDKTYFFNILPVFEKSKFKIIITVKKGKFKVFALKDNLYNKPLLTPFKPKKAKKWIIIVNDRYLNNKQEGLNFYFKHTVYPYIGPIDENLNPIKMAKSKDIVKYFEILKAYKAGRDVLDEINEFIKNYPNSVFLSDILYLKLKILDANNESEGVISLGKEWIKKYAFSEKLPEVLLLIGKNYSKIGFASDASYYYNRIITEYPNTKWAYLAMIYLADQLYMMGDEKKAFKLYEKALYSTNDLDIASLAAARLAQRYMDKGNIKRAIEYYKKIYRANKKFILKDKNKAYELAKMLASHGIYDLAINIGEDILKGLKKLDDLYEPLLYNLALWAYEDGKYDLALKFVERYLKEFPYGDYADAVSSLRDKILFQIPENNLTKKLEYIDKILEKYRGDIAKKALVEKVKILYKMKKYKEVLELEDKFKDFDEKLFPDKDKFFKKVKREYAIELLKQNRCFEAISLIKKYKLTLDKKWDDEIYKCAIKSKNYDIASVICNKYLNSPDDEVFIKWMKRKIEALKGLRDYKNIVTAVDDLCGVMKKGCYPYLLDKFFALWKLKEYKEALKVAKQLEKHQDIRNADAFIKIVNWALKSNDNLLAASYAKKIIELQNRFKAHPYSPFVEFVFAKYTKNKEEAIKVLKELLKRVKGEDKARALFMLANLTGDKKYIDECLKVKDSKLWKGLCKDAKGLF